MAGMAAGAVITQIVVPLVTSVIAASSQQSARGVAAGMSAFNMIQQGAQRRAAVDAAKGYSQATDATVKREMLDRQIAATAPGTTAQMPGSGGQPGPFVFAGGGPTNLGAVPEADLYHWEEASRALPGTVGANPANAAQATANVQRLAPQGDNVASMVGGDVASPATEQFREAESLYDTVGAFKNIISGSGLAGGTQVQTSDTRSPVTLKYQVPIEEAPGVKGVPVESVQGTMPQGSTARFTDEQGVDWTLTNPRPGMPKAPPGARIFEGPGGRFKIVNPDGSVIDLPATEGWEKNPVEYIVDYGKDGQPIIRK